MAEYNAYQAAAAEKNPAQQVKALDDFVSKYPNSALMIYIYPLYYQAYSQLKNYPKVIEYADKLVALGEKADAGARYQAFMLALLLTTPSSRTPRKQDRRRGSRARQVCSWLPRWPG